MRNSGLQPPGSPRGRRIAEAVTIAAISAAMYRLQQTGDPLVIVWAAGAIILLTVAATIARALEGGLSRLFGMSQPDEEPDEGQPDDERHVDQASIDDQIDADDRRLLPENC
jgi:hypothetical protein